MVRKSRVFEKVTTKTIDAAYAISIIAIIVSFLLELAIVALFVFRGIEYVKLYQHDLSVPNEVYYTGWVNTFGWGGVIFVGAVILLIVSVIFVRVILGAVYDAKLTRYAAEDIASKKEAKPAPKAQPAPLPPVTAGVCYPCVYYGNTRPCKSGK